MKSIAPISLDHLRVVKYDSAMSNIRYKVIVNPISGRGNGQRIIPMLETYLQRLGLGFDLSISEYPGHIIELSKRAAENGYDVVVGVGGDGTANEVLNGISQAKARNDINVAMSTIGAGRGNDFAFGIGMPEEIEAACRILAADQRQWIDIGLVYSDQFPDGRYFGNSLGIGFDAVVTMEALKMTWLSGVPNYIAAALKTVFLYYKAPQIKIQYDDQEMVLPALMVSVMNGVRQGGTFIMSADACNNDGLFDLCIVREVSKPRIFTLIPHFFKGTQYGQEEVFFHQARHLTITALDGVLPAHMDGEIISTDSTKFEIELLPKRLQIISPL